MKATTRSRPAVAATSSPIDAATLRRFALPATLAAHVALATTVLVVGLVVGESTSPAARESNWLMPAPSQAVLLAAAVTLRERFDRRSLAALVGAAAGVSLVYSAVCLSRATLFAYVVAPMFLSAILFAAMRTSDWRWRDESTTVGPEFTPRTRHAIAALGAILWTGIVATLFWTQGDLIVEFFGGPAWDYTTRDYVTTIAGPIVCGTTVVACVLASSGPRFHPVIATGVLVASSLLGGYVVRWILAADRVLENHAPWFSDPDTVGAIASNRAAIAGVLTLATLYALRFGGLRIDRASRPDETTPASRVPGERS